MACAKYSFDLHTETSRDSRKMPSPYCINFPEFKFDSVSTVNIELGSKRFQKQMSQSVHGIKVFVEMVKHILLRYMTFTVFPSGK